MKFVVRIPSEKVDHEEKGNIYIYFLVNLLKKIDLEIVHRAYTKHQIVDFITQMKK